MPEHGLTLSTISHSGHSMIISERARAARLANTCPALQCIVFSNVVQWHRLSPLLSPLHRYQSTPSLPFDDLFVKKIDRVLFILLRLRLRRKSSLWQSNGS
ncbi:hypothetical protein ARMGADRAFT_1020926 [Armillaria gallica]|uniref:Uncharacterized protein n=1 Tax=Armillaria gallica TaxID=47427 RepID=A0A2H3CG97_ARMGA|nr:hypothetical protein ARMGADRAFT_1020926 [Armillaria gallica]